MKGKSSKYGNLQFFAFFIVCPFSMVYDVFSLLSLKLFSNRIPVALICNPYSPILFS